MEMTVISPRPPHLELKKLVVRMGGRMCSPHARKFWVIIIGGGNKGGPVRLPPEVVSRTR